MSYREDPASINAKTRGEILTFVKDALLDHAHFYRGCVERAGVLAIKVDWSRHDAMCAAACALDRVIAKGKDQVSRNLKVDPLIETIVDAIRSSLIQEITNRSSVVAREPDVDSKGST